MSDVFYKVVWVIGWPAFFASSSPISIGEEHVPPRGPCIIAATHQCPYDIPLLIRHTPRLLDFVSITEVFHNPLLAWFYGSLNAFPLERSRPDAPAARVILDRLRRGRTVAMFPEGGFKTGATSVIHTRRIKPGIGRIANLSGAPIIPCVLINSPAYARPASWLPIRRTRYGVIYGEPLSPTLDPEALETNLVDAFVSLHRRLSAEMGLGVAAQPAAER